jgi:hypothetical protein
MIMASVLLFAWFLGAGSYAAAQRVRQAYIRRGEPDPSMVFLLEEITAWVAARGGRPAA